MTTPNLSDALTRLGRSLAPPDPAAPDAELLGQFLADRDEDSFAKIVRRHAPMVFGVCRRVTGNHHLAEDAFQAVFVVLAAKAGSVRPREAVAAWLYGVAYRTALRARTMAERRRRREALVASLPEHVRPDANPAEGADIAAVLDEEIARLAEHLRVPVVLCELEGRARSEVAADLGIAQGTLSSRLAAARKALAARLRKRGVALSASALTAALGQLAGANVPAELIARAVAAPNFTPAAVAELSNGVIRAMFAHQLKSFTCAALGAVALAGGLLLADAPAPDAPPAPEPVPRVAFAQESKPLPKGPNKLLVFRDGHFTLMDPDGTNDKRVSKDREMYHPAGGARLSPDGKHLAVMVPGLLSPDDGTRGAKKRSAFLHVRGLDDKEPGTRFDIEGQTLAWSPDGTEIACCDFEDGKQPVTTHHIVNVKTKEKAALKLPNDHIFTDWSRDGKFFLTMRVVGAEKLRARLYLMNRDGTEHKALTDEDQMAMFGRISPDGKRVLFHRFPIGADDKPDQRKGELSVVDVATAKVTKVDGVPLNATVLNYCWSPDGKKIAYVWRQVHDGKVEDVIDKETESHLVVCDPDGKNQKTLLTEKAMGQWIVTLGQPDWR